MGWFIVGSTMLVLISNLAVLSFNYRYWADPASFDNYDSFASNVFRSHRLLSVLALVGISGYSREQMEEVGNDIIFDDLVVPMLMAMMIIVNNFLQAFVQVLTAGLIVVILWYRQQEVKPSAILSHPGFAGWLFKISFSLLYLLSLIELVLGGTRFVISSNIVIFVPLFLYLGAVQWFRVSTDQEFGVQDPGYDLLYRQAGQSSRD